MTKSAQNPICTCRDFHFLKLVVIGNQLQDTSKTFHEKGQVRSVYFIDFKYYLVAYVMSGEHTCIHFVQCTHEETMGGGVQKGLLLLFSFGAGWEK